MTRQQETISLKDFFNTFLIEKRLIGFFIGLFFIAGLVVTILNGMNLKAGDQIVVPFVIEEGVQTQQKIDKTYIVRIVNQRIAQEFPDTLFSFSTITNAISLSMPFSDDFEPRFAKLLGVLKKSPIDSSIEKITIVSPRLRTLDSLYPQYLEKREAAMYALFDMHKLFKKYFPNKAKDSEIESSEVPEMRKAFLKMSANLGLAMYELSQSGKFSDQQQKDLRTQLVGIETRWAQAYIGLEDINRAIQTYQTEANQNNILLAGLFWDYLDFRPEQSDLHSLVLNAGLKKKETAIKLFCLFLAAGFMLGSFLAVFKRFVLQRPTI